MFTAIPREMAYQDPWIMTLAARTQMLMVKRRRIAYFYEYPDTSTFRYRVFNMTECLAADHGGDVSAGWFDRRDLASGGRFIDLATVLVICRARYNAAVAAMVARARARGLPVLFDCDDLVFDLQRVHLLLDSLAADQSDELAWDYWYSYVGRVGATLRLCDGFITTNHYLADRAGELLPTFRTAVVPNYLNGAQQELCEGFHRMKQASGWARDERLHIGYFSGSPSHARDFAIAAPALARLMRRDPRIVLRVVGFLDLPGEMAVLRDRVEFFPLQDIMNLQRLIAEVEINVAPLQDNIFTNCKSELKFFEAAICGTLTIATPTFAFRGAIRDGETGLLAAAYEWDAALAQAVALVDDRAAYAAFAERAASSVKAAYGWDTQSAAIVQAVFGAP